MSKKYYRVYFEWYCTPETHWGAPCEDRLTFNPKEYFEDGQEFELYDSENEKKKTLKFLRRKIVQQ